MSIIRRIYYIVKNLKIKDLTYRTITSADKIFYGLADDSNMHYTSVDDITGASSNWEADDASTIKPKSSKLVKATKIQEDTTHSFITDAERLDWDSKAAGTHIHDLSALTEDTTHRLVTDTEKASWNNKIIFTYYT